jgi:hypothetical protein
LLISSSSSNSETSFTVLSFSILPGLGFGVNSILSAFWGCLSSHHVIQCRELFLYFTYISPLWQNCQSLFLFTTLCTGCKFFFQLCYDFWVSTRRCIFLTSHFLTCVTFFIYCIGDFLYPLLGFSFCNSCFLIFDSPVSWKLLFSISVASFQALILFASWDESALLAKLFTVHWHVLLVCRILIMGFFLILKSVSLHLAQTSLFYGANKIYHLLLNVSEGFPNIHWKNCNTKSYHWDYLVEKTVHHKVKCTWYGYLLFKYS